MSGERTGQSWGCPECGHAKAGHDERGCPACECSYRFAAVAARPAGEDAGACRICGHPRAEHEGDGEMVHGFVPSSPVPDEVREEIIGALAERLNPRTGMSERAVERLADAVLATPALRRYLDAAAAVERVRVIHRPIDPEGYPAEGDELAYCAGDGFVWPCPTARVMAGEQP